MTSMTKKTFICALVSCVSLRRDFIVDYNSVECQESVNPPPPPPSLNCEPTTLPAAWQRSPCRGGPHSWRSHCWGRRGRRKTGSSSRTQSCWTARPGQATSCSCWASRGSAGRPAGGQACRRSASSPPRARRWGKPGCSRRGTGRWQPGWLGDGVRSLQLQHDKLMV